MKNKTLVGEYHKDGYEISMADGEVLYTAGANACDSTAPGRHVNLLTIRKWCIHTGKEMAKEMGVVWGGAEKAIPEIAMG
jgi:hypothetical protein